jgi:(S)-sulfolactate dehydrogenase
MEARGLIVRNRTQVRDGLLESAGGLRVVGRLGVGLDNIDLEACRQRNIAVCPARGANDTAVAEYVITTAMVLLRGAYAFSAQVMAGTWPRQAAIGREIAGQHFGLVGYGAIARETARRAQALGASVLAYDPHLPADDPVWASATRAPDLASVLEAADVLSLHVPLTTETSGLVDAQAIARMKHDAILISTARGGVVDEGALISALQSGALAGAALDVFVEEPLGATAGARFADCPNLVLTPHIAGVTVESNVRVSAVTADSVRAVLESGA